MEVGECLVGWCSPSSLLGSDICGQYCDLLRLEAVNDLFKVSRELFQAFVDDDVGWTYMHYGPFSSPDQFHEWLSGQAVSKDPYFYVVTSKDKRSLGFISFLRIQQTIGSVEIGHVRFSPELKRTIMATEAIFIMMQLVFALGFRRCEWKCDSLNCASANAARRFGFQYEGTFRQAAIYKNRNRDTFWFSVIDKEWPRNKLGFEEWLSSSNFDHDGLQKQKLRVNT